MGHPWGRRPPRRARRLEARDELQEVARPRARRAQRRTAANGLGILVVLVQEADHQEADVRQLLPICDAAMPMRPLSPSPRASTRSDGWARHGVHFAAQGVHQDEILVHETMSSPVCGKQFQQPARWAIHRRRCSSSSSAVGEPWRNKTL